jgi:hypothetical protein
MTFISPKDRIPKERIMGMAKATLQALLTCSEKAVDQGLRERLRLYIRMGCENGFLLGITDTEKELGKLMSRANVRSRAMGWL